MTMTRIILYSVAVGLITFTNCISLANGLNLEDTVTHDYPDYPDYLNHGTYLVVGVFAVEDNARNYSKYVQQQGWSAYYAFYEQTQYYYVYTLASSSKPEVVSACLDLRDKSEFDDAWVLVAADQASDQLSETENESDATPWVADGAEEKMVQSEADDEEETSKADEPTTLFFKFHAYHANSLQPVPATVKIIDGAHSRSLAETPTNQTQEIERIQIMDSVLQIIPNAMGYRKVQFDLPLDISSSDSILNLLEWEGDTLMMGIPLLRLRKGDIQVMYNTYFYGNSSVMRERSRYELDEMVKLLKEEPNMRIKLHGHTNGNGRGFIYTFSPEEKNFFELRQNNEYKKKGVGAVKLSALRTETIKYYLEDKGISADRVETEGWGGKRMLYDEDSPMSKHNIRVEVEVLEQ